MQVMWGGWKGYFQQLTVEKESIQTSLQEVHITAYLEVLYLCYDSASR